MSAFPEIRRGQPLVAPPALARLTAFLTQEGLLVAVVALFVLFWSIGAPDWLAADSWLTFLGGREIVAHGIPHTDSLAILTSGHAWVDQQWLAQLSLWQLVRIGGIRLALLATILCLAVPLVLAIVLARRRGAAPLAIVPFAVVPGLAFSSFLRAQLFSQLLFVPLLALLAAESHRPSRRVFVVFPLLALWANLHGAAVEGAALVALLGVCEAAAARRASVRAGALVLGPWLCLLATPYGTQTIDYYRSTLGNPILRRALTEWAAPTFPSLYGLALFTLAGAAIALVARRPRALTAFELGALALTLLGGLLAVRSIVWFGYASLVLLPPLVTARRRCSAETPRRAVTSGGSRTRLA